MILKAFFIVFGILISFLGFSYIKEAKELKDNDFDANEVSKTMGCGVAVCIFAFLMIFVGIVLPL